MTTVLELDGTMLSQRNCPKAKLHSNKIFLNVFSVVLVKAAKSGFHDHFLTSLDQFQNIFLEFPCDCVDFFTLIKSKYPIMDPVIISIPA